MANDVDEVANMRLGGTRDWLLEKIRNWAEGKPGDAHGSPYFLVVGDSWIGEVRCSGVNAERDDPARLIRTVAYQLGKKYPEVGHHIVDCEKKEEGFVAGANVSRAFQGLILDSLAALKSEVVLVLDALDECGIVGSVDRAAFLLAFGKTAFPPNVKLFVTSRPEADIVQMLPFSARYPLALEEELNHQDLFVFAKDRISHKFPLESEQLQHERAEALAARSGGHFMWLHPACEELRDCADGEEALKDLLQRETVGPANQRMDKLYLRTLERAFPGASGVDDAGGWCRYFRAIVGTIVAVRVPLSLETISELIHMGAKISAVAELVGRISSLLYIADDQIRIIHKSFSDFIIDPNRCTDSRFLVFREDCEVQITSGCFRILNGLLKRNMCNIEVHQFNTDVSDLHERIRTRIPNHLQYAAQYSVSHLMACPTSRIAEFNTLLDSFWREQLLNWMEVVSVLDLVIPVTAHLLHLKEWTKADQIQRQIQANTIKLIQGASRFIQEFAVPITLSAPHVWTSAAPFAPSETTKQPYSNIIGNV
ncbi:POC1 centriolar protein A [Rhizophlyctis rosea]|nr:POC1 centriolar protein A [Rhizophlyctis rosea]